MGLRSRKALTSGFFALLTLACGSPNGEVRVPREKPSEPPNAPLDLEPKTPRERAHALASKMTREEKIRYLSGSPDFYVPGIERLGIPPLKMADGPVGCRNWGPNTAYPATIGLAAAFDRDLTKKVGASIARDCRARGVHILLAPGVNLQRTPTSGRNFEYFGEDPLVSEENVIAYLEGVHSGGVLATVKHFAFNDQEWDRNRVESHLSERAARELYLRPFQAAVTRGGAKIVMTSYNLVDGDFATHSSRLLRDILRKEWGFSGFVMSDWEATKDTLAAFLAGLDLETPRARHYTKEKIEPLLASGALLESALDEKVENILRTAIEAGFFDRPQTIERPSPDPDSVLVARQAAEKGIVLLENREKKGKPTLPFDATLKKLAVIGPNASPGVTGGAGSSHVTPSANESLPSVLRATRPDLEVRTHPGIRVQSAYSGLGESEFVGPVKREIFLGENLSGKPIEEKNVSTIELHPPDEGPTKGVGPEHYSVRFTGKVRLDKAGKYRVLTNADDGTRVLVDGKKVLEDWTSHAPKTNEAIATLSAGEHTIVVEYFQGILGARLEFGFGPVRPIGTKVGKKELDETLSGVDAIVVMVGFGQHTRENSLDAEFEPFWPPGWARSAGIVEAEDDDRPFELPEAQLETLRIASATGKPVIVVGMAGGGIDFRPFVSKIDALLWAFYPGQEGSRALSSILFGDVNPSAKLPVTFAERYADHPAAASYDRRIPLAERTRSLAELCSSETLAMAERGPGKKRDDGKERFLTPYCEDVFLGYRGFERDGKAPLYPFGFGLSYSRFSIESGKPTLENGVVSNIVKVKNEGTRAGAEIVQFYASSPASRERPKKVLVDYVRVELAAGEEKTITLRATPWSLASYDTVRKEYFVPGGEWSLLVGNSSKTATVSGTLSIGERSAP